MIEISKNIYYDKGQYFTTNLFLKSTINNLILNNPKLILEPAMGRGDLVEYVKNNSDNENIPLLNNDVRTKPVR